MVWHLLLVRRAGRPTPDPHPAAAAASRALVDKRRVVPRDARDHDVGGGGAAWRARHRPHARVFHRGVARLGRRSRVFAAAARDPAVARAGPLPHGPALPARRVAAVFHSRAAGAIPAVHRHDGRVHPAADGAVGSAATPRCGDRGADRGVRGGIAGPVGGAQAQSPTAIPVWAGSGVVGGRVGDPAGRLRGHVAVAAGGAVGRGRAAAAPDRRCRVGRDVRDDAQPAADLPARRRAHPVCGTAAPAPAAGTGHLVRLAGAGAVDLGRVVGLGLYLCTNQPDGLA